MPAASDHHDNHGMLRPPQFGLRMLMVAISLLCLLFAVMSVVGALWSSALLMFLLLAACHVLGNAVGTHLRDHASNAAADAEPWMTTRTAAPAILKEHKLTCKTRLSRAMVAITVLGALAGGALGGFALSSANWQRINLAGIVLATVSSAILGAFWSFLASTFWLTIRSAWREALGQPDRSTAKTRPTNICPNPSGPTIEAKST